MIRSGLCGEEMPTDSKVRFIPVAMTHPFPSSYKPIPLPQIHVHLSSDTLEFPACLVAHFPTSPQHLHLCVALGCYQVRKSSLSRTLTTVSHRPFGFSSNRHTFHDPRRP